MARRASFLAIGCLEQLARECESSKPHIVKNIRKCFYVDDFLSGAETVEEVLALAKEVSDVFVQRMLLASQMEHK